MNSYLLLRCMRSSTFHKTYYRIGRNPIQVASVFLKHHTLQSNIFLNRSFSLSSWPAILSTSAPVAFFQEWTVYFHSVTGLPWWAVIMVATFGLRSSIMLPLAIHQAQVMARLYNLKGELDNIAKELSKEVTQASRMYNWDFKTTARTFNQHMHKFRSEYIIRDNCHPFKSIIIVFIQLPIWICFSASLRNLVYMLPHRDADALIIFEQLKSEGVLWFSNMTIPDFFIIPILLGIVNLTLIEVYSLRALTSGSIIEKVIRYVSRITTVFLMYIATITPSTVSFYWLCSSTYGLIQNLVLMSPKIRRAMNIPKTPLESQAPFQDMRNNLKKKFGHASKA